MKRKTVLSLTQKELSLLAGVLGFVEAGEVDDGPLDAEHPQQRSANLRLFNRLWDKVCQARGR